jgi:hypothetical protein
MDLFRTDISFKNLKDSLPVTPRHPFEDDNLKIIAMYSVNPAMDGELVMISLLSEEKVFAVDDR